MKAFYFILEIVVGLIVFFLLLFFSLIMPRYAQVMLDIGLSSPLWQTLSLFGLFGVCIPYVLGWYHILKMNEMRKQSSFISTDGLYSLKFVQYCFSLIAVIYALGLPILFPSADLDDAPGVVLFSLLFVILSATISFVASRVKRKVEKRLAEQTVT